MVYFGGGWRSWSGRRSRGQSECPFPGSPALGEHRGGRLWASLPWKGLCPGGGAPPRGAPQLCTSLCRWRALLMPRERQGEKWPSLSFLGEKVRLQREVEALLTYLNGSCQAIFIPFKPVAQTGQRCYLCFIWMLGEWARGWESNVGAALLVFWRVKWCDRVVLWKRGRPRPSTEVIEGA